MLLRIGEIARFQLRYSVPGFFSRLRREDAFRDVEVDSGGIALQHDVNRLRVNCAHRLHLLTSGDVSQRAHLYFIVSERCVDEYTVCVAFDGLKQAQVIREIHEFQTDRAIGCERLPPSRRTHGRRTLRCPERCCNSRCLECFSDFW